MTTGYYYAIFPFCGGVKKKDDKKTKAFYDWATKGIPVMNRNMKFICSPFEVCIRISKSSQT